MEIRKYYKVIEKIGEGSFSDVYKVRRLKSKLLFAAKILKKIYEDESEVQLCPEINTMLKIQNHTNILGIVQVICDPLPGRIALIFDLMNMSMYDYIKSRRRYLSELKAKNFLFQMSCGLQYLHRNRIFHRDIKPENILIKLDENRSLDKKINEIIKIADFGSSCNMNKNPPYTEYVSTRWYRAPECLLTDGYYGPKMDIWSLGCVFYEMLTLQPLFPGETTFDQLHRIHYILGTPSSRVLLRFKQRDLNLSFPKMQPYSIYKLLPSISEAGLDVLSKMLTYLPELRIDANKLLFHKYFEDIRTLALKRNNSVKNFESVPVLPAKKINIISPNDVFKLSNDAVRGVASKTESLDTYFIHNHDKIMENLDLLKQKERAWGMNPGIAKTALVKNIQASKIKCKK